MWSYYISGQDGAGTIDAVGDDVDEECLDQRVWVYLAGSGRPQGTAATYVCVPAVEAMTLPDDVRFEQGAGLRIPFVTAHRCLHADGPFGDVELSANFPTYASALELGAVVASYATDATGVATFRHTAAMERNAVVRLVLLCTIDPEVVRATATDVGTALFAGELVTLPADASARADRRLSRRRRGRHGRADTGGDPLEVLGPEEQLWTTS